MSRRDSLLSVCVCACVRACVCVLMYYSFLLLCLSFQTITFLWFNNYAMICAIKRVM